MYLGEPLPAAEGWEKSNWFETFSIVIQLGVYCAALQHSLTAAWNVYDFW